MATRLPTPRQRQRIAWSVVLAIMAPGIVLLLVTSMVAAIMAAH